MKRMFVKSMALMLILVMMLTMFSACGSKEEDPTIDAVVDAAVKAALDAAVVPTNVTIDADGNQITIEDAAGKSVQELLDMAKITLNDGDILSVAPYQTMSGNITVQVLRVQNVTITVADPASETTVQHHMMVMGGTVADAIAAAGIQLTDEHLVDCELNASVADGMQIGVSVPVAEEEVVEETTAPASSGSSSSSGNSSSSGSRPSSGSGSNSGSSSGGSSSSTKPTEPKPTEPKPTEAEKTVVSVEIYEDCDGSGHGVKVITYSDGSQEEVPF